MKLPHDWRTRLGAPHGARGSFDPRALQDTIRTALSSAGLDTSAGPMQGVTDTIERALGAAGLLDLPAGRAAARGRTLDGTAEEVRPDQARRVLPRATPAPDTGRFVAEVYRGAAGKLGYRLYVPACHDAATEASLPLVVMLHGCTQSPEDFAAGTRMNMLAERHGFLVAYPGQSRKANGSSCWNWFKEEHHVRDGGEPSLIAGIAQHVAANHRVDPRRVFVAGLSAGAAMAVILGETHPELFAAVAAHSGLPYGAAHDVPSAYAAMNGGGTMNGMSRLGAKRRMRRPRSKAATHAVPTIVFHGDADTTVNVRNGAEIAEQATKALQARMSDPADLRTAIEHGGESGGRTHQRTTLTDATGRPLVEQWLLHGAGHAWSGGSPTGTFTDPGGPDASAEIVRFFLAQRGAR